MGRCQRHVKWANMRKQVVRREETQVLDAITYLKSALDELAADVEAGEEFDITAGQWEFVRDYYEGLVFALGIYGSRKVTELTIDIVGELVD